MRREAIRPWFKAALWLIVIGVVFLFGETLFFLWRDGYHYYAETAAEKLCDMIGKSICTAGNVVALICIVLLPFSKHDPA
ncbi:hypothetical protein [Nibribacter koreensis]|uniref:Uncharacterized protein n=1 Tax=Nibribacter koreensis TaxID=1084519 RepID=A0ABP8FB78_9BACT